MKGEKFKSSKNSNGKVSNLHLGNNGSSMCGMVINNPSGLECSSGSDLSTMDVSFERDRRNMEHFKSLHSINVKPLAPQNFVFTFRLPMPESPSRKEIASILEELLNEIIY